MSKQRVSIIILAAFLCLMTLGVLPVNAQPLPPGSIHGTPLLRFFPRSITIHTSSPRGAPPQTPVGGGCKGFLGFPDPIAYQSCISINGTPLVVPDAWIWPVGSESWTGCLITVGMYYSTNGTNFFLEPNDPVGGNCLSVLQNNQTGHLVGHTRLPQNIHEYFTCVMVVITTTQHRATYGPSKGPIQFCC